MLPSDGRLDRKTGDALERQLAKFDRHEKRIVKKLLFGMDISPAWELQGYVGQVIDEYGSLALLYLSMATSFPTA